MNVDPIVELLPNKRVETLTIEWSKFIPLVNAAAFAERVPRAVLDDCRNQFLPQLRELVTDRTCLGFWSRLFECHRPPLVELRAACSHIGIPSVNQFDWSHTPNLWPNMEILEFFNKSHSTLNALKSIAPHLGEFRKSQKSYLNLTLNEVEVVLSPLDFLAQTGHPLPIELCVRTVRFCIEKSCLCHQQE